MRKVFSIMMLVLLSSFAQAQTTGKVSGRVVDADGKGLNAISVSLLKAKDSSLAKIAVTDKNGQYDFANIKQGSYLLSITSVGFVRKSVKGIDVAESPVTVPDVTLQAASKELSGVTVQSSRPLVETKIDKTIVNVDASPTNAGATAMDVLEKSPGIMVDKDGNLSLKGKQGVIVLIDGKPSYLGGQDLANLLKNMPANQLDQIEIMTQPSAKYDASGNSGIINLRTKKSKSMGFNGSVNLSYIQGVYPKSPNSFNFNYRKGKVNLFSNLSYSYWEGFNDLQLDRVLADTLTLKQYSTPHFSGKNYSARIGMDYSVNNKTTIGIVLNGNYNPRNADVSSLTSRYDQNGQLVSTNTAISNSYDPWKNFGGNLNYRRTLKKQGEELTADLDYVRYISRSDQTSDNYNFDPNGNPKDIPYLLRGLLSQDITIYSGKVDYTLPLSKEAKFEAGVKSSLVSTDNNAPYETLNTSGAWVPDARSDHFKYDENINAAYVNYSKQIKKWGVQTGLRMEHTHSVGTQVLLDKKIVRDLVQLFPTVYLSYKLDDKNQFGLSYGRRIDRPNYQDLNPFQRILDQYTYQQGNPYLTPQFSNNIELSHNFHGALNTTLNYTTTTDIINDVIKHPAGTAVTYQTKENIAKRRNIGAAISFNAPLTKFWTTSFYVNGFTNHYEGIVNGQPLNVDLASFMLNASEQFKFAKTWGAEVSGFYRSTTQDAGVLVSEPMGVVSFGASKQILKGKGTLRLNVSDPFYIQKFRGYTNFDNINLHIQSSWDNRRVGLSFTYRFSKGQNAQPQRRKTGSAQDEQNRVGANQQQQ